MQALTTIACDESASEGENLMRSRHPVFVHGSVNLSQEEAENFLAMLRALTGIKAPELKSRFALEPKHRSRLMIALVALADTANIYFVEKSFFIVAKMIALLPAEYAARNGLDLHFSGLGRLMANTLHDGGREAMGEQRWASLLDSYNSVIRTYLRAGDVAPTVHPFFEALRDARANCGEGEVREVLDFIWDARHITHHYEGMSSVQIRELDPMFPSLTTVASTWDARLGGAPFEFLADNYSGLDETTRSTIIEMVRDPSSMGVPLPSAALKAIRLTDSKGDPRVQVADIVAGVGREVAGMALNRVFDDPLQQVAYPMLDRSIMTSDASPLAKLVQRSRRVAHPTGGYGHDR
ncbi:hypothetical protein [Microbacterium testaceum]|uniref:hypothetical protein n=1 Tax=Microbacterium testaceum TaxID=2033 RepID=UPI001245E217|nr:hypothetical protein [Microbacterium testaceum]